MGGLDGLSGIVGPRFLDGILLLLVGELVVLRYWLGLRSRSEWVPAMALYVASGAALIVALRLALVGRPGSELALALLVALLAHVGLLLVLRVRLRGDRRLPDR